MLLALSSKLAVFLSCVSWIPFCVFCYVSHAVAAGTYPWLARISPSEAWSEDPITVGCSGVHRKFSWGGVLCNGTWWSFVFGVRFLWRHNLTSNSCFQTNVLAKFVDIICIFFYIHSPYFMCHGTEYKLLALQVRLSEENTLNATTQQFITAKLSGCALKQ